MSDALVDQRSMYVVERGTAILSGVQAIVRVIFEQARRDLDAGFNIASFISGYPGSPLGGLDQEFQRQKAMFGDAHIVHIPGHNEELAATAVWGSQLASLAERPRFDGVVGMWHAKAPGLDRAADAIRHAQYVGTSTRGGVLACVGDDPGAKSSSLPVSSEDQMRTLGLPVLVPGSVQDVIDLGAHGIALSRSSGLWTGLRIVTGVADGVASVSLDDRRFAPQLPEIVWRGQKYTPRVNGLLAPPHTVQIEEELVGPRLTLAREYGLLNDLNTTTHSSSSDWIGILAVGHLYAEIMTALGLLGLSSQDLHDLGVRVGHVRMPHPIHPTMIGDFCRGLEEVVVVEEKQGLLETDLRDVLYGNADRPRIVGKTDGAGAAFLPMHGTLDAQLVAPLIGERLRKRVSPERIRIPSPVRARLPLLSVQRTPFYCAGCPHSTGTLVPEGAHVGAGIGCHGMAAMMDPVRVGLVETSTHMGGEGAQWIGMSPFVELDHIFQNVGDGTYFHSAQLAVQAAVASGTHITYKLLVNDAVAMTGGQNPAWSDAVPVRNIAEVLLQQGVRRVLITTDDVGKYRRIHLPKGVAVWDRRRIIEAQELLRSEPGVTVLIHDQRCAAENRRDRKRGKLPQPNERVFINERVCEGCGDCGAKSACLAVEPVETEFGRKTQINQTMCNFDYSCLKGDCPSFVTVTVDETKRAQKSKRALGVSEHFARRLEADLPAPALVVADDDVLVRMPGIGGTGVVTISHILAVAALQDGKHTAGLDQTGMSQKGGPVVSDLRISAGEIHGTSKAISSTVDLLLAFDLLGAAAAGNVETLAPGRSVAVVSTSKIPTGQMVSRPDITYPDVDAFCAELAVALGDDRVYVLDVQQITLALFNSAVAANTFLLGVAFQVGALPLSVKSLEQAIRFNGVEVEVNLAAFRAGRLWVLDPQLVDSEVGSVEPRPAVGATESQRSFFGADLPAEIAEGAERMARDLVGYQSVRYAERYVAGVVRVRESEVAVDPASTALTDAVAKNLYKLMAYKDEYEVARLSLDPEYTAAIRDQFGDGATVKWNLHPPILKAMGYNKKIRLGRWFTPVFIVLRGMRQVRGTKADPFGYAKVRRVERDLLRCYRSVLDEVVGTVTADTLELAKALAALPDMVRGYEELKLARAETYLDESRRLLLEFQTATTTDESLQAL